MKLIKNTVIPLPSGGGKFFVDFIRGRIPTYMAVIITTSLMLASLAKFDVTDSEFRPIQQLDKKTKDIGNAVDNLPKWFSEFTPPIESEDVVFEFYPEISQIKQLEKETESAPDLVYRLYPFLDNADPVIKLAALDSIDGINHPDAESVLVEMLNDDSALIQVEVLEHLTEHTSFDSGPYLEPLLFSSNRGVRIAAIKALADLENVTMLPALEGLLYDQDSQIRNAAVVAIDDIQSANLKKHINVLSRDEDDLVRANIHSILLEQAFFPDD